MSIISRIISTLDPVLINYRLTLQFILPTIVTGLDHQLRGQQLPTVELGIFVDDSFVTKYRDLGHDIDRYIGKLVDIIRKL